MKTTLTVELNEPRLALPAAVDTAYHVRIEAKRLERAFSHATDTAPIRTTIANLHALADALLASEGAAVIQEVTR